MIDFNKKNEPQEAVFCVRFGFAGGPSAPVVDCESGEPVVVDGVGVFIDDSQVDELVAGQDDISGVFQVKGGVVLSDDSYEIDLPGSDDEIVSEKRFFVKLHVDRLDEIRLML